MSNLTPIPIELILRSVQKDNEFISHLRMKVLDLIDSFSYFKVLNFDSQILDVFSSLLFYLANYKFTKNRNSPGEEYVRIKKNVDKKTNMTVLTYVLLLSSHSLILRKLYEKISSVQNYLNKYIKEKSLEMKSFTLHIIHQVIQKSLEKFPSEEDFFTKIEEIQNCMFFLNQRYYDFFQALFNIKYEKISEIVVSEELLIGSGSFGFLGKLSFLKLFFELILFCVKIKDLFKEEEQTLINSKSNIFESQNKIQKLNFRLKGTQQKRLNSRNSEGKSCLLCLDQRRNTSITPCGHLFCWECIIKHLQKSQNCPFCRKMCLAQNVIYLQNFT